MDVAGWGVKKIRKPFWSEFSLSMYSTASASLCISPWVTRSVLPVDNRGKVGQGLNLFYDSDDITASATCCTHFLVRRVISQSATSRWTVAFLGTVVDEEPFGSGTRREMKTSKNITTAATIESRRKVSIWWHHDLAWSVLRFKLTARTRSERIVTHIETTEIMTEMRPPVSLQNWNINPTPSKKAAVVINSKTPLKRHCNSNWAVM